MMSLVVARDRGYFAGIGSSYVIKSTKDKYLI